MRKSFCSMMFLSVLLATLNATGADKTKYYSIRMDDKLIGYAEISSQTLTREGKQLILLKSATTLKMALMGTQRNILLDSETLLDAETHRPVSYRLTNTTNEVVSHIDSDFAERIVRTWSYRKGDERGDPVETELPEGGVAILGNNNFAHWQLVLAKAAHGEADGKAKFAVYVPDVQQMEHLEFDRQDSAELVIAGEKRQAVSWHLEKAQMELAADARPVTSCACTCHSRRPPLSWLTRA